MTRSGFSFHPGERVDIAKELGNLRALTAAEMGFAETRWIKRVRRSMWIHGGCAALCAALALTAFYDQEEMKRGIVAYSDTFDIISVSTCQMGIDLTKPGSRIGMDSELEMSALTDDVQVIPMQLNEGLSTHENERQRKGLFSGQLSHTL